MSFHSRHFQNNSQLNFLAFAFLLPHFDFILFDLIVFDLVDKELQSEC